VQTFLAGEGRVHQLRYTPDGKLLVVDLRGEPTGHPWMGFDFSPSRELVWWDWAKGEPTRRFRLRDSLYGPGGAQTGTEEEREDWQPDGPAFDVSFCFDPFRVATAWEWTNKEDGVCVFDADGRRTLDLKCPYKTHVMRLALAPDGKSLAVATVGDMDGRAGIEVWAVPTGVPSEDAEPEPWSWEQALRARKLAFQQQGVDLNLDPVAFVFDGRFVVAAGGGAVAVWDRQAPPVVAEPEEPDERLDWVRRFETVEVRPGFDVCAADLSGGDTKLAVAGGGLAVCECASGEWACFPAPTDVTAVCFGAAGRRLLISTRSGGVELWDVDGRRQLRALNGGIGPIASVAFSPDGLTCAAGGEDGQVVVWDVDA
jgi:WD40 repeat protein